MGNIESAEALPLGRQVNPSDDPIVKRTRSGSSPRGTVERQRSVRRAASGFSERETGQLRPMSRTKSLDGIAGQQMTSSKPSRSVRKNQRPNSKRGKNLARSPNLGDQDLDDIYDFVKHLKQTTLGGGLLEEFVIRQTAEIDGGDELSEAKLNSLPIDIEFNRGHAQAIAKDQTLPACAC